MQTFGLLDVIWNGQSIPMEKGAKVRLSGYQQNPVTYGRRVDFAQEYKAGNAEGVTNLRQGERLSDKHTVGSGELQLQLDTKQTIVAPDAFMTEGPPEATGGEGGKLTLKWSFGDYEEILG